MHGLLLSIYIEPPVVPIVAEQRALDVQLKPAELLTEAPTAAGPAPQAEQPAIEAPQPEAQAVAAPPPPTTAAAPAPQNQRELQEKVQQEVQQESLGVAPVDSYITSSSSAAAEYAERFLQTPCTLAEKASQIRNCARETIAFEAYPAGEHTEWLKALFKDDPFAGDNFDEDMQKIDALIAQSATLDELNDPTALGAHVIAAQRRDIRAEIARIDNKYRSVNLLAILPKVIRAARNARDHFSTAP